MQSKWTKRQAPLTVLQTPESFVNNLIRFNVDSLLTPVNTASTLQVDTKVVMVFLGPNPFTSGLPSTALNELLLFSKVAQFFPY